jgi:hypothetical protein
MAIRSHLINAFPATEKILTALAALQHCDVPVWSHGALSAKAVKDRALAVLIANCHLLLAASRLFEKRYFH